MASHTEVLMKWNYLQLFFCVIQVYHIISTPSWTPSEFWFDGKETECSLDTCLEFEPHYIQKPG